MRRPIWNLSREETVARVEEILCADVDYLTEEQAEEVEQLAEHLSLRNEFLYETRAAGR